MKRKSILLLLCCCVFATTVVLALYAASDRIVHEPNNFLRVYQKMAVVKAAELNIEYNSFYIAAITDDKIYLGNIAAPFNVLIIDHSLTDTLHVMIKVKGIEKPSVYKSATVKIDSPYFYLADGIKPIIYRGKIGAWVAEPFMHDHAFFNQLVPVSDTRLAIRANEAVTRNLVLGELQHDAPYVKLNNQLIQKQVDGIFCSDGMLQYNKDLNKLIYMYYYRNEYIVYDTNLKLDYRGHTIDTFSRAQIKVEHINSENTNTLTSRKFTNLKFSTSGNNLFINSNLMAKNDQEGMLDLQSVIDVYDLQSNRYKFSFSVPNYDEKKKLRDFVVHNNEKLIALYDRYMVMYNLNIKDTSDYQ